MSADGPRCHAWREREGGAACELIDVVPAASLMEVQAMTEEVPDGWQEPFARGGDPDCITRPVARASPRQSEILQLAARGYAPGLCLSWRAALSSVMSIRSAISSVTRSSALTSAVVSVTTSARRLDHSPGLLTTQGRRA